MKKLFIHNLLFRLISPLFGGVFVYLMILLINNNVQQLKEAFLGQELYFCIILSYGIQEYSRASLFLFEKINITKSVFWKFFFQLVISIVVCMLLVSLLTHLYFKIFLGYSPNTGEFITLGSIFSVVTIIYLTLYISHGFLFKTNYEKLNNERENKLLVEEDFFQFKKGINPVLLFESLESLIVLMNKYPEKAIHLVDHFSSVYRYILSRRKRELISLEQEIEVTVELLELFDYLPYRDTRLKADKKIDTMIVPGSLIHIVECIVRTAIASKDLQLIIELSEDDKHFTLKYNAQEKIIKSIDLHEVIKGVNDQYRYFSEQPLKVLKKAGQQIITIPKLRFNESSYY